MIKTFEDFTKTLDNEDFLDNSRKDPYIPGSFKKIQALKLKNKGKLKFKKRKVNVLPQSDILGINTKDASMILRKS